MLEVQYQNRVPQWLIRSLDDFVQWLNTQHSSNKRIVVTLTNHTRLISDGRALWGCFAIYKGGKARIFIACGAQPRLFSNRSERESYMMYVVAHEFCHLERWLAGYIDHNHRGIPQRTIALLKRYFNYKRRALCSAPST